MTEIERLPFVIATLKAELERQGHTVVVRINAQGDKRYRINGAAWGLPGDVFIRRAEALMLRRLKKETAS